jgi:hypothetical protein
MRQQAALSWERLLSKCLPGGYLDSPASQCLSLDWCSFILVTQKTFVPCLRVNSSFDRRTHLPKASGGRMEEEEEEREEGCALDYKRRLPEQVISVLKLFDPFLCF